MQDIGTIAGIGANRSEGFQRGSTGMMKDNDLLGFLMVLVDEPVVLCGAQPKVAQPKTPANHLSEL